LKYEKDKIEYQLCCVRSLFWVAMMEAFQTRDWLMAVFWIAIGIVFLAADNIKKD
jgi:hypothetical protein